ncbi:YbaY family lipoprotein [Pseudomonas sp. NFX98]|uniref:YbaY family lipoprotein n=1 Tax=Pseudomonas sp. NFX98 TaxID=3399122 RepID=UPI0039FBA5BB
MSNDPVKTISGKVHYFERIALLPNSTLNVRLLDVSLADAPAQELAVQIIPNAEKAGLDFNLAYRLADVLNGHTYAIRASITHGDDLIFSSNQHHPVVLGVDHLKGQNVLVSLV